MGLPRPFELALHEGTRTDRLGGTAWVGNRIIKNEKVLKDRELDLRLQLNKKFD